MDWHKLTKRERLSMVWHQQYDTIGFADGWKRRRSCQRSKDSQGRSNDRKWWKNRARSRGVEAVEAVWSGFSFLNGQISQSYCAWKLGWKVGTQANPGYDLVFMPWISARMLFHTSDCVCAPSLLSEEHLTICQSTQMLDKNSKPDTSHLKIHLPVNGRFTVGLQVQQPTLWFCASALKIGIQTLIFDQCSETFPGFFGSLVWKQVVLLCHTRIFLFALVDIGACNGCLQTISSVWWLVKCALPPKTRQDMTAEMDQKKRWWLQSHWWIFVVDLLS